MRPVHRDVRGLSATGRVHIVLTGDLPMAFSTWWNTGWKQLTRDICGRDKAWMIRCGRTTWYVVDYLSPDVLHNTSDSLDKHIESVTTHSR